MSITNNKANLYTIMEDRKSVRVYDPTFKIPQAELEEIIQEATSAPSSSNLQAWRFLVIQDEAVKTELRAIANNQEQVETSSAVIAVLGNAEMYQQVEQIYTQNVAEGHMGDAQKDLMIANTLRTYPSAPLEVRKILLHLMQVLFQCNLCLSPKKKAMIL